VGRWVGPAWALKHTQQPLLLARGSIILRQLCAIKVLRGLQHWLFQQLLAPHWAGLCERASTRWTWVRCMSNQPHTHPQSSLSYVWVSCMSDQLHKNPIRPSS
jgi:hypothetical protein